MCYKIVYQDETEQYTEAFDADDPIQVDRYPAYYIDTDHGELPLKPTYNTNSIIKEKRQENWRSISLQ